MKIKICIRSFNFLITNTVKRVPAQMRLVDLLQYIFTENKKIFFSASFSSFKSFKGMQGMRN